MPRARNVFVWGCIKGLTPSRLERKNGIQISPQCSLEKGEVRVSVVHCIAEAVFSVCDLFHVFGEKIFNFKHGRRVSKKRWRRTYQV